MAGACLACRKPAPRARAATIRYMLLRGLTRRAIRSPGRAIRRQRRYERVRRRYSEGDTPVQRRNARVKALCSEKPTMNVISVME